MEALQIFFRRLRDLFRRRRIESEMDEEMREHYGTLVQANLASGLNEVDARAAAR